MFKQDIYIIEKNEPIAKNVYRMILAGDTTAIKATGQFVNIKIEGLFLRRPISICDWYRDTITIIYKVVGQGTAAMSRMKAGQTLDMLVGLGNGYRTDIPAITAPILIGGGVGVPPLYGLCRELIAKGLSPKVILGFNCAEEVFYQEEFRALGADVAVSTVDGSVGVKGFVTDVPDCATGAFDYFFTCGPEPMLKAVYHALDCPGQLSFEERMGCGFGACMGCSCKTKYGSKRICVNGPVLMKDEVVW